MRRRDFIAGLGSAAASAAALPAMSRAQQPSPPVIGWLGLGATSPQFAAAFARGLAEMSYVEGRNVVIEARNTEDDVARLPELAADLVHRRVNVIAAAGSTPVAVAAKNATTTIPIVFGLGSDPVEMGLVQSLNRPGGNITGYTEMQADVLSKRLGVLHQLVPAARHFGLLDDPRNPISKQLLREARAAAATMGLPVEVLSVTDDTGVEAAFESLADKGIDALIFSPGPFIFTRRERIMQLAASHSVPAAYWLREFPVAGGLMSYGSSIEEMYRQVGIYTGRILKGAKPAELPVFRATKFELVINAKTASLLGLQVPSMLLAIADEVIE
jgi:putative tryptophan/tyrosine transport system substrate-binding protein